MVVLRGRKRGKGNQLQKGYKKSSGGYINVHYFPGDVKSPNYTFQIGVV